MKLYDARREAAQLKRNGVMSAFEVPLTREGPLCCCRTKRAVGEGKLLKPFTLMNVFLYDSKLFRDWVQEQAVGCHFIGLDRTRLYLISLIDDVSTAR